MLFIHLSALCGIFILGCCLLAAEKKCRTFPVFLPVLLFLAAFLLRLAAASLSRGFGSDTACFAAWADRLFQTGPGAFYSPDTFTDYPPGYLYILWLLGGIKSIFGIPDYSALHFVLLKFPAILCDMACGLLLFREFSAEGNKSRALFLCAAYLFNPAVILNSSVWGQVDSLYTLAVLYMCLCLIRGKMYSAFIAFGAGVLIKLQTLFFAPVLFVGMLDWIFREGKEKALPRLFRSLFQAFSAALGTGILCLPFGPGNVLAQVSDTMGSYPYAAVNACNFWGLLGLNWVSQDEPFLGVPCRFIGWACIFAASALVLFLGIKKRGDNKRYPFLGALLLCTVFLFSVRMHERYLYPALVLLLLSCAWRPCRLTRLCYLGFTLMHFYNTADVLFRYDPADYDRKSPFILLVSAGMLACGVLLYVTAYKVYLKNDYSDGASPFSSGRTGFLSPGSAPGGAGEIQLSRRIKPPGRTDILCILSVTLVYSCIALYDLGSRQAPVTSFDMTQDQSIELDFGSGIPASLSYYIAPWQDRVFTLEGKSEETGEWVSFGEITLENVFTWQEIPLETGTGRLRLTLRDTQACLLELVFTDRTGAALTPVNAADYPSLFDEDSLYTGEGTFRNGMYFDEIYHARTAYEFLRGLTSYENTHPPLGKIFIALGVAVFGMNPFGWRIAGVLFGIAMVPLVYLFARQITRASLPAALACVLFSFDFMHFTQTRIATIDVYVTFFVMAMYYFMYRYWCLSFYDTPLKKTWLPLGACGVCMGLGIASKWTGIYAGAGLAVLFFSALYRRYREYLLAKEDPSGSSGGISHAHILETFPSAAGKTILFCLVFFVALPALIYLLSYLPFRDYSGRGLIARTLHNQQTMFSYHSNMDAPHPYASSWYEWPLIKRPIWYYSRVVTQTAEGGLREGISAFGNPAVWWPGIPAFGYMLFLWIRKKDRTAAFLTVSYLAQYLPWFFVTRSTFIYHYFPSVVFVVLMITYSFTRLGKKLPPKFFRTAVLLYTGLALALFLLFYPVLSGQPVEASFVVRYLRWLPGWVLTAK